MAMSASDKKTDKKQGVSAEQARKIQVSEQIASVLKRDWEELQDKQAKSGKRMKPGQHIRTVSLTKNRRGETSVKVGMANGGHLVDGIGINAAEAFKEKAKEEYARSRIAEFLRKIREQGWDAVEGEIPPELREAVLKACQKENISMASASEKAEQKRLHAALRKASEKSAAAILTAAAAVSSPILVVSPARKAQMEAEARQVVNSARKCIAASAAFKNVDVKSVEQRRPGSRSAKVTFTKKMNDGTMREVTLVGDRINISKLKFDEAEQLFEKQAGGGILSAEEQSRLDEWKKYGVTNKEELYAKGQKFVTQISERNISASLKTALAEEKRILRQQEAEELMSPDNQVSAAKLAQIQFVFKKNDHGIPLSKEEQSLFKAVSARVKTAEELDAPGNSARKIEILKSNKFFMHNADGSLTNITAEKAMLEHNPAAYRAQMEKGALPKRDTTQKPVFNVSQGMSLADVTEAARAAKNVISKEDKTKVRLLNLYAKMHGTDKVSTEALNWAKENAPAAGILMKKRGELEKSGVSAAEFKTEIEKAAKTAATQTESKQHQSAPSKPQAAAEKPAQKQQQPAPASKPQTDKASPALVKDNKASKIQENKVAYAMKKEQEKKAPKAPVMEILRATQNTR